MQNAKFKMTLSRRSILYFAFCILNSVLCFLVYPFYAAMAALAALLGGVIAFTYAGDSLKAPVLPWNSKKTWFGLLVFAVGAALLCIVALYLFSCPLFRKASGAPEWPYVKTLAILAGVGAGVLWSLEGPGTEAFRVPLGVGGLVWLLATFLSFATRDLPARTPVQPEELPYALAINVALGVTIVSMRFATVPATVLGVIIGVLVFFFAHWPGYLLLVLFVVAGSGLSRVGWDRKAKLGAAEAHGGRRCIENVAANLGVPAICCLIYPASGGNGAFLMAYAGAVVAALADTVSAEIGVLSVAQPVLITTRKPVPHGTNGAVSLLGFGAAALSCIVAGALAWSDGFLARALSEASSKSARTMAIAAGILVLAGMLGTIVDSLLGATIEDRVAGVGKGAVNFVCTLTGALVAGGLTAVWL